MKERQHHPRGTHRGGKRQQAGRSHGRHTATIRVHRDAESGAYHAMPMEQCYHISPMYVCLDKWASPDAIQWTFCDDVREPCDCCGRKCHDPDWIPIWTALPRDEAYCMECAGDIGLEVIVCDCK
jgi:hypothetical protein